jgi:hypothetical protein
MDTPQDPKQEIKTPKSVSPEELEKILKDDTVPKYYGSAFIVGNSPTDMFMVAISNGKPQFSINLSFSSAKELLKILTKRVEEIEENIGYEIKTFQIKR